MPDFVITEEEVDRENERRWQEKRGHKGRKPYYERSSKYREGDRIHNFVLLERTNPKITQGGFLLVQWICLCDCGVKFTTTSKQISRGYRKSCGCLTVAGLYKIKNSKEVIATRRLNSYRQGAKRRKLSFTLIYSDVFNFIYSNCFYCGEPPNTAVKSKNHEELTNGIDRVDSQLGYFKENCVSCCRFCNFSKSDRTVEEFENFLDRLVIFRTKRIK